MADANNKQNVNTPVLSGGSCLHRGRRLSDDTSGNVGGSGGDGAGAGAADSGGGGGGRATDGTPHGLGDSRWRRAPGEEPRARAVGGTGAGRRGRCAQAACARHGASPRGGGGSCTRQPRQANSQLQPVRPRAPPLADGQQQVCSAQPVPIAAPALRAVTAAAAARTAARQRARRAASAVPPARAQAAAAAAVARSGRGSGGGGDDGRAGGGNSGGIVGGGNSGGGGGGGCDDYNGSVGGGNGGRHRLAATVGHRRATAEAGGGSRRSPPAGRGAWGTIGGGP